MELPEPCDERVPQMEVRIDGDMAHAWGRFTFNVGTRVNHCGRKLVSAAPNGQRMEDHPHRLDHRDDRLRVAVISERRGAGA